MKKPKHQPDAPPQERFPRSLAADEVKSGALSAEDMAAEQATDLPDREAMSIIAIGDNVAAPTNEATAINYQSDYSVAVADADQVVFIEQTDLDPDTSDSTAGEPLRGNSRGGNRG